MITIESGGQLESIQKDKKIKSIAFGVEGNRSRTINMWVNENSLSYLTLVEALNLRDELELAIQKSIKY